MRNIFLEKSYTKSGGDTIPRLEIEHIFGSVV